MVWAKNGTPDTLGSAGDSIDISDLTGTIFNQFMCHMISNGTITTEKRFNNDSGSNYAERTSTDGATDATAVSQTAQNDDPTSWTASQPAFVVTYTIGILAEEKLSISNSVIGNESGAANTPHRGEGVAKWANTSAEITRITQVNQGANDYDTSSNLSALGSDGVESLNVQDGAVYYETDTNKSYVLYNNSWTEI